MDKTDNVNGAGELDRLIQKIRLVAIGSELRTILTEIINGVLDLVNCECATLRMYAPQIGLITVANSTISEDKPGLSKALSDLSACQKAISCRQMVFEVEEVNLKPEMARPYNSVLSIPLQNTVQELFGTISVYLKGKEKPDLKTLEIFALYCAAVLEIQSLRQAVTLSRETSKLTNPPQSDMTRAILEEAPALIVVVDSQGQIVFFNRACELATGFSRTDVLGTNLLKQFVPMEWQEQVSRRFQDINAPEVRQPHCNPWRTKSGSTRMIEWRCIPFLPDQGRGCSVLGVGLDTMNSVT